MVYYHLKEVPVLLFLVQKNRMDGLFSYKGEKDGSEKYKS